MRYKRGCHPNDFWKTYFTSSSYVHKFRKEHGEPDVIEVRQTFNDSLQAREWESKVIRRMRMVKSKRWLNKKDPKGKFYCNGHTEEVRAKISEANTGKTKSDETKKKISEANKGKSRSHSEESKKKMSEAKKGSVTALNIETGETGRIPRELFYSRKDIYFHNSSKVYKEWKAKQAD